MGYSARDVCRHIWAWKTVFLIFIAPVALLPVVVVVGSPEAKCAYVVVLMAIYWITESLPVGVTALLPVVLFPLFEIVSSGDIASEYMNDVNMLFLGGLTMAVAIEYWNLHRRVALIVLMFVGSEPRWLMLGMMLATWFLSMWISNTATTAMMIPIAEAILLQLKVTNRNNKKNSNGEEMQPVADTNGSTEINVRDEKKALSTNDVNVTMTTKPDKLKESNGNHYDVTTGNNDNKDDEGDDSDVEDAKFVRMCKGLSLCICYAANSGGIASLTGTGPNLALKSHADSIYTSRGIHNPVTFGTWMAFGLPLSAIVLITCWIWLQILYLRCQGLCSCCTGKKQDADTKERIKRVIRNEYNKLGPVVAGQVMIIILFLILVTLWITRDLGGVAGWGKGFNPHVKDGAPAILIAILLFALPSTWPCLRSYSNPAHPLKWASEKKGIILAGPLEIRPLLHWEVVHERMPWHLFFLLGGGYALSRGCQDSGLSQWIGHQLEFFSDWNEWLILIIICYITAAATEVTSNTAIATLLMPIMSQLAINTGVHPLYYMFPAALACSFAFMLPVATPPNAIVFAYGRLRIIDMAKAGFVMNIVAVPILVAITGTLGNAIFDFDDVPEEFLNRTATAVAASI